MQLAKRIGPFLFFFRFEFSKYEMSEKTDIGFRVPKYNQDVGKGQNSSNKILSTTCVLLVFFRTTGFRWPEEISCFLIFRNGAVR